MWAAERLWWDETKTIHVAWTSWLTMANRQDGISGPAVESPLELWWPPNVKPPRVKAWFWLKWFVYRHFKRTRLGCYLRGHPLSRSNVRFGVQAP